VTDISYTLASRNLSTYEGTSIRWGGVIVDVKNEENFTLLQVLSYPLTFNDRPDLRERSEGRFVIKSPKFLDPAIYVEGREITVAGTIKDDIERTIDDDTLRLPLLFSETIYLWPIADGYYGSPYHWRRGYHMQYWF
jgi:outer membrane lipoprotein